MSKDAPLYLALVAGLFAVGIVVLFLASGGSGASRGDAPATTTQEWADRERALEVETDRREDFRFTSRPEVNQSRDALEGHFDAPDATYRLEFRDRPQEGPNGSSANATWMAVELDFVGLVEYRDETGDDTFNPPVDEIVNRVWLASNRSSSMTVEETNIGAKRVTATYPLHGGGGSMKIVLLVSPTSYDVRNNEHPPTVTALDVRLDDFPFREDDTDVALNVGLSTPGPLSIDANESRIRIPGAGEDDSFVGQFAWTRHLGGTSSFSSATVVEATGGDAATTGSEANVLFTYPRGEKFVHATALGIHREPTITQQALQFLGNRYVFAAGLAGTLALLGGSMYVKLRGEDEGPPYA